MSTPVKTTKTAPPAPPTSEEVNVPVAYAMLGLGVVAAFYIAKQAPALTKEQSRSARRAALGIIGFGGLLYAACKYWKFGWCADIGV